MNSRLLVAVVLLSGGAALVACDKKESKQGEGAAATGQAATQAAAGGGGAGEAKELFAQRCATCHGPTGKGDGAAAAALNPKPRDFSDPSWQAGVTDDHLKKVIVGGGPAAGKSAMMPPNPDLEAKPQVVAGLVGVLRGLKK